MIRVKSQWHIWYDTSSVIIYDPRPIHDCISYRPYLAHKHVFSIISRITYFIHESVLGAIMYQ